jgi:hypothetical protein
VGWALKRTSQCMRCPWRVDVDPHDIPNGYTEENHRGLACTIAQPGDFRGSSSAMACHESVVGDEAHCVGWLMNQLGPGNNIGLRLRMMTCTNARDIKLVGEQHEHFEDTLPG